MRVTVRVRPGASRTRVGGSFGDGAQRALVVAVSARAVDGAATQAKSHSGNLSDLAQYKCSSCASCCAGSALPSAIPRLLEPTAAPAVFAEEMVTVDAFVSDGPDRPPRTHLV